MPPHKRGSAVGNPREWKEHVILTAYLEAKNNGQTGIASVYEKIMQEKGITIPEIRSQDLKFGGHGYKQPRWSAKKPNWGIMVYAVEGDGLAATADQLVGPYPVHGGTKEAEAKFLAAFEHKKVTDAKDGDYVMVKVPMEIMKQFQDTITWGSNYPHQTTYKKRPLMCVYDATKNYCESLLGVRLNIDDENFFIDHPMVQMDGVPFPDTLRVVQELIDPYGLAICRVRVAPGYNLKGDIAQWRGVLGINPLAMSDRSTSNAEFLQQSPQSDITQWLFEYRDDVLRPSIACGLTGVHTGAAMTGETGGHATYVSPRSSSSSSALLSFQIARKEWAQWWKKAPVFAPLDPKKVIEPVTPKEQVEPIFDVDRWSWKQPHSTAVTVPPARFDVLTCCNRHVHYHDLGIPGICDVCWESLCEYMQCQDCAKMKIGLLKPAFSYVGFDWQKQEIHLKCRGCQKDYTIDRTFSVKKARNAVAKLLQALERHAEDERINKLVDEHHKAVSEEKLLPKPESANGEATLVDKVLEDIGDEWNKWWPH